MKIEVSSLIPFAAVDYDDGQKILDQARPAIKRGEPVELDFQGISIYASPFFNGSVALLINEFGSESVERLLTMSHLNPEGEIISKRSIDNAKTMNDPEKQRRLAQALEHDDEP